MSLQHKYNLIIQHQQDALRALRQAREDLMNIQEQHNKITDKLQDNIELIRELKSDNTSISIDESEDDSGSKSGLRNIATNFLGDVRDAVTGTANTIFGSKDSSSSPTVHMPVTEHQHAPSSASPTHVTTGLAEQQLQPIPERSSEENEGTPDSLDSNTSPKPGNKFGRFSMAPLSKRELEYDKKLRHGDELSTKNTSIGDADAGGEYKGPHLSLTSIHDTGHPMRVGEKYGRFTITHVEDQVGGRKKQNKQSNSTLKRRKKSSNKKSIKRKHKRKSKSDTK